INLMLNKQRQLLRISMSNENLYSSSYRVAAITAIVLALLLVPAPLLPPHRLAEAIESMMIGFSWKAAYFTATVGLQTLFYGSIGILSAFIVKRGSTFRRRLLQTI